MGLLIFQRGIDMPVKVTFSGHNLRKIAKTPKSSSVAAGFFEDSKYPDGTSVVSVAVKNEYGEANIPARPFMQQTFENNQAKWLKFITQALAKQSGNYDTNTIANQLGLLMQGDIRDTIVNGDFVPNAPYTIAKKGKDTPLRDTLLMLQSVDYQVVKK